MPLSDVSYDLLTALQSKLEAVNIYEVYIEDCEEAGDDETRRLFEEILQEEEQHVERLSARLEQLVRDGKFRD
jgi:bacterioferritin (cytochrome b1)